MEVSIKTIPEFDRRAKRLAKKYKSLKSDLQLTVLSLRQNPTQGNDLGSGVYKVRLAIASKGGGKSGIRRLRPRLLTALRAVKPSRLTHTKRYRPIIIES